MLPPKREEIHSYADDNDEREVGARELVENEFPVKVERGFNEDNAEEFFNGLERELAMHTDKRESRHEVRNGNTEEEMNDEELQERELPEGHEEMPEEDEEEEDEKEARKLAEVKELEMLKRVLEHELEEKLARDMAEEENKREFGENEEDIELFRRREGSYARELPEESEEIYNREIVPEDAEEEYDQKREFSEEENEKNEEDEGEYLGKLSDRSVMDERALNHKREEEEEIAAPREMNFRRMLEDSVEEFPDWNDEDDRGSRLEELSKRAEEFQKRMLERQSERERQRFDYHDNEEREQEELRERQRERALEISRKIHEREMEGRKQPEEIGSHGMRREDRERFRFRARSE